MNRFIRTFINTSTAQQARNILGLNYVEGTFTPAFSATGATYAYTTQYGVYNKLGSIVTFNLKIVLNTSGNTLGTAALSVTGLPYTSSSTAEVPCFMRWSGSTGTYVTVIAQVNASAATISFLGATAATATPTALNSNGLLHATNGSTVWISGVYPT
ncbi:MAG TPA: hypothetical protein VIY48_19915 [Candidatus Paceibacterota bacterium]